ncbi:TPA: accessory Sec system glycosyltransferase GtfA, partial [Streptococcus agalactiae]|nr:accessory Sec system glycosyltransferase GtfA [Streptococcus agalactiae]
MVVYNLNRGIGWASSGVEYAQAYRSEVFRKLGVEAKFIFTDMFQNENIEHLTRNI